METFHVGDSVLEHRRGDLEHPGVLHLQDDVYDACHEEWDMSKRLADRWVVISRGVIVAIHERQDREDDREHIQKLYTLEFPDPNLWSDECWARQAKRDYDRACKERQFMVECAGMSAEERWAKRSSARLRAALREEGFLRRILPPTSLESHDS